MKLRLLSFSLSAMLLAAGAFITGCTQTDTPGTTAFTDTFRDMTGLTNGTVYKFLVTGTSANTKITAVSSFASGTVRVFWTRGAGDTSNVTVETNSTSPNAMSWAPAAFTSMKRIYETADPANPSGLILGDPSTTASITGAQKLSIDLVLATLPDVLPNPVLSLQAADITGGVPSGKMTDIANFHKVTGGLANDMESASASGSFPSGTGRFFDLPYQNFKDTSIVFYAKTADAQPHYARLEIVPQPTGSTTAGYLWGDSPTNKRFIDINISYQTAANMGFVGREGATRRATNTPRVGRGAVIR